jgi:hypothetical protein
LVAVLLSLTLVVGGCSTGDTPPETSERDFEEGTLSSSREPTSGGLTETTKGPGQRTLLRVEGGQRTRFSGLCTAGNREYVISGSPSKTYAFEASSFSCRIKKQDPGAGNLKVTMVSGDSTRSVQQTNAQGGILNVSRGE